MGSAFPSAFAALQPGATDDDIRSLGEAVAPFVVPAQVTALYRWRGGGDGGVFGGWRMRPIDELIDWYRFTVDELESPRTWLPVFDDQIVNVVTLDVPGLAPSDRSVWYGHTHDVPLCRLFDSVAALLDVVSDAVEAGRLVHEEGRVGILDQGIVTSLDDSSWTDLRLVRSPGSYCLPDPPPGTESNRCDGSDWPAAWRAGLPQL